MPYGMSVFFQTVLHYNIQNKNSRKFNQFFDHRDNDLI